MPGTARKYKSVNLPSTAIEESISSFGERSWSTGESTSPQLTTKQGAGGSSNKQALEVEAKSIGRRCGEQAPEDHVSPSGLFTVEAQ